MRRLQTQILACIGLTLAVSVAACVTDDDETANDTISNEASSGEDAGADSDGDAGPGNGGDGDGDGDGGDVEPQSGVWRYNGTLEEDTCNLGTGGYDLGSYGVVNNGDGTFTVVTETEDPFDCQLQGQGAFHCPARGGVAPDSMGANAEAKVEITVDGVFDSSTAGSGVQVGEVTCTGPDCTLIESVLDIEFPCILTESFTTTRTSS